MKVLLVTPYFSGEKGGVEIISEKIAEALLKNHDLTVDWISSRTSTGKIKKPSKINKIEIPCVNLLHRFLGIPLPIWNPFWSVKLFRIIRESDLVHLHDTICPGSVFVAIWSVFLRKPLVVTQHVSRKPYKSFVARCLLEIAIVIFTRNILKRADQVVFISKVVMDFFSMVKYKNTPVLIVNGIDFDDFFLPPLARMKKSDITIVKNNKTLTGLFVGRFVFIKGLNVIKEVAKLTPQVNWLLVGKGPIDPNQWKCSNVKVLGEVDHSDIFRVYHEADFLVLPSTGEGFPLVVQEAMRSGLPVIIPRETAFAIEGVENAVIKGGPDTESLYKAVLDICDGRVDLKEYSNKGLVFSEEHFRMTACANKYFEIYKSLYCRDRSFGVL